MTEAQSSSAGHGPVAVAPPLATLVRALPGLLAVGVGGLLPLWGVLSLGWSVLAVAGAYVVEAAAVGLLGRHRAKRARGPGRRDDDAKLVTEFFKTYITVVMASALIVSMVFGGRLIRPVGGKPEGVHEALLTWQYWAVVAAMVALQGVAHWWDFVHNGERELLPPEGFVHEPLRRLFLLQGTVLAVGLLVYWRALGSDGLVALVALTAAGSVLMAASARQRVARIRAAIEAGLPAEATPRHRHAPRGGRKRR